MSPLFFQRILLIKKNPKIIFFGTFFFFGGHHLVIKNLIIRFLTNMMFYHSYTIQISIFLVNKAIKWKKHDFWTYIAFLWDTLSSRQNFLLMEHLIFAYSLM